jgi:hypothetical protein
MLATTVLTVFEKIKSTDPWMDAKLNSSTHFKKFYNVLTFFELVYKFAKNAYMTAKIFFQTFSIWVSKNAFDADFESVEKVSRKFPRRKLEG